VIFDESAIRITEENGTPVDLSREGGSFSLGRADDGRQIGGIQTNQPGGANIGDAALPSSVVTPEMDAAYLDALDKNDHERIQSILTKSKLFKVIAWRLTDEKVNVGDSMPNSKVWKKGEYEWEPTDQDHDGASAFKNWSFMSNYAEWSSHPSVTITLIGGEKASRAKGDPGLKGEVVVKNPVVLATFKSKGFPSNWKATEDSKIPLSRRFNQSPPAESGAKNTQ
jgi:hypothetical protein